MNVICVDDHPIMLRGLYNTVTELLPGASVRPFTKAKDALEFAKSDGCDLLICEIELHDMSGLTLAKQIKKLNSDVNIIFLTVCDAKEHAQEVFTIKPSGYLVKPATKEELQIELKNLRYNVNDA